MAVYHKTPQDSNRDISRPNEIPPIAPPMPDNITGNIGNNFKVQELGKNFFQGEEMANQFAQKQMDKPVPPPGDPIGDQLGNMFMQPFSRKKTKQERVNPTKKAKQGLHSSGRYASKINMNGDLVQPFNNKDKKVQAQKIPQEPNLPKPKKERIISGGYERVIKPHRRKQEMPVNVTQRINMNGDPEKKYKMPLEGVQDLQDMGAVKKDKKGQYVVNENPQSVKDTLRFPKGTKHYSGKPYKPGQLIDESDYEDIIKKVNKS